MSRLDAELEPKAAAGRRIEVIHGGGDRRKWTRDEKAQAVEASLVPGVVVSEVARLYGLTPQQLFAWRREARRSSELTSAPHFVPAIAGNDDESAAALSAPPDTPPQAARPHSIELDVAGTSVFIWRGAEPAMVCAIIGALKASK